MTDLEVASVAGSPAPAGDLTEREQRILLREARRALAEAESLPDIATLVAKADVVRVAARKAKLSEEACLDWEEFSLDAQREAGQMLATMDKNSGGRPPETGVTETRVSPPKLEDLGVSRNQSKRWQAVASLPDEDYEDYKEKARAKGEITRAGAIKRAKQARAAQASPPEPNPAPVGVFSTIVADPPWRYGNTSTRGAAQDHYSTLSIEQLCGVEPLPDGSYLTKDVVVPRTADQAHLYLWATAGHLREAFHVMEAWGFTYKTYLVWVKPQMGMGNYFRVSTELVLFGIRGDMRTLPAARSIKNYFEARRVKHSAKPRDFRDIVKRASPGPYLEMFARCRRTELIAGCECSRCEDGWEVWGNQA